MHKQIKDEIVTLKAKINRLKSWDKNAEIAEEIVKDFSSINAHVSIGIQNGQLHGVLIHCYPKELKQMTNLLKILADKGFHIKGKPHDYPELDRRHWTLEEKGTNHPVILSCFFQKGKSKCVYKEVGKKEEPIYELICE